jgi:hypothetical protein
MKNWKTTLTGLLSSLTAALTALAALPYELGDIAQVIPPEHKALVFKVGLWATIALRIIKALNTEDSKPAK